MYKPIESWILNQAAYYLEYSHYDKAIALLQALQLIDKSNLNIYKMLSYVYLKKSQFKQSINLANEYIINAKNTEDIKQMEWLKKYAVFKMKSEQNRDKNLIIKQHL